MFSKNQKKKKKNRVQVINKNLKGSTHVEYQMKENKRHFFLGIDLFLVIYLIII